MFDNGDHGVSEEGKYILAEFCVLFPGVCQGAAVT